MNSPYLLSPIVSLTMFVLRPTTRILLRLADSWIGSLGQKHCYSTMALLLVSKDQDDYIKTAVTAPRLCQHIIEDSKK